MGHLLGYARVSAAEQNPVLQHDALYTAGCARVWTDATSGAGDDRPALAKVLDRTLAGRESADTQARRGGRPPKMTAAKLRQAKGMPAHGTSVTEITDVLGVARATMYRHLQQGAHT